jgi:hypothetical protein
MLTINEKGEYVYTDFEETPLTEEQITQQYHDLVIDLIREKYSIDDEFKFINVGLNDRNNLDYQAYRDYVEQCKNNAKITLNIT